MHTRTEVCNSALERIPSFQLFSHHLCFDLVRKGTNWRYASHPELWEGRLTKEGRQLAEEALAEAEQALDQRVESLEAKVN